MDRGDPVIELEIKRLDMPVAVIRLKERMEVLSSAVMNGGNVIADTIMIMEVPKRYDNRDPLSDLRETAKRLFLPEDTVGLMTAAEVEEVVSVSKTEHNGISTHSVATAGLTNIVTAGDVIPDIELRLEMSLKKRKGYRPGTINIIGVSSLPMTDAAKANMIMTITEAKTAALHSFGYHETGTTSDSVAVVSPIGNEREKYSGTGTDLGISMARSVRSAVSSSIIKRDDLRDMGTFIDQLFNAGITKEGMWDSALEIYDPNPAWDTEDIKRRFMEKLNIHSNDINVSSLIQAAMELERLGNADCICAMPRGMFAQDPVHLVADEMLGMQLAQYISGTRGLFEFHRFDRHKPGIIKALGPFMDDIICGLVGGIMSSIYTELFEGEI